MYHKDLLNLVFQQFEDGHTMLNFSEISRKCHQIFSQHIKIEKNRVGDKQMKNVCNQKHGIFRRWYANGKPMLECNYFHDEFHGIWREWYGNGQLILKCNYFHDELHGIFRRWFSNGQLMSEVNYVHNITHNM